MVLQQTVGLCQGGGGKQEGKCYLVPTRTCHNLTLEAATCVHVCAWLPSHCTAHVRVTRIHTGSDHTPSPLPPLTVTPAGQAPAPPSPAWRSPSPPSSPCHCGWSSQAGGRGHTWGEGQQSQCWGQTHWRAHLATHTHTPELLMSFRKCLDVLSG